MSAELWTPTTIPDVLFGRSTTFTDERGSFREVWRASLTATLDEPFVQANLSTSRAGALRGMHFHRRQVDLWFVVEGAVSAATTDLRRFLGGDDIAVSSQVTELAPGDMLVIPRLVAHGFLAREETKLLYLVTNEYDGTDEHGFAWDDPFAAIAWPASSPILSNRDQVNPTLAELAETLRKRA